jgi:ADP-heptose:LPS heptosyltransferase
MHPVALSRTQPHPAAPCAAARPWRSAWPPSRILAIRLQAFGDVVATLPYLRALQSALPHASIDLVTRREDADLPGAVRLFRHVEALGGGRHERTQLLALSMLLPRLVARRYDVVLDLQNNRVSRAIRRAVAPRAWASFDTQSLVHGGERIRRTIDAAGFPLACIEAALPLRDPDLGLSVLREAGWDPSRELVVLSPAGAFPTRNWPIERYARFAQLWRECRPAQFVILGLPRVSDKAAALQSALGNGLLNLVGKTTPSQALGVVQRASFVLAEDCGLLHMAWTSGVPTLALFGSSRHVWSAPLGEHTRCLHSGDLPCGSCMEATCRFGDVHCLTRFTPEFVAEQALALIEQASKIGTKTLAGPAEAGPYASHA